MVMTHGAVSYHGSGESMASRPSGPPDVERPDEGADECQEFGGCEVNARAAAVAVAERAVADEVGELAERLLIGWIGRVEPSVWDELLASWVGALLTADQAALHVSTIRSHAGDSVTY